MSAKLPPAALTAMRGQLPTLADDVVAAIVDEVPSYRDAFSGPMGETISNAVELALGGFLTLASRGRPVDLSAAPAVEGSYQLGRGEARSGRTTDALLSAYRIGARVAWRELATTGRVRQRLLERIAHHLLRDAPVDQVLAATERAAWTPPTTLTAVLVPESQARQVLAAISPATLTVVDPPDLDEGVLLLVPDAHGHRRATLLRTLADRGALAGPARPWLEVRASYDRALRARAAGLEVDTEAHLVELVLDADRPARDDLRAKLLAPLADLRPGTVEKLTDTLRAWLLHQGRRDDVAEALFVHPQTVRYRMGQLRELYGERLDDPETVLALTFAL